MSGEEWVAGENPGEPLWIGGIDWDPPVFESTSVEAFDGKLPRCELRELEPRDFDPTEWPWKPRFGFYHQTVDVAAAAEGLNWIFAGVGEAVAAAGRAFDGLAETLCRSMWPESFRALARARDRAERARRIAASQVRPLVIDGAAYRQRVRSRRGR